MVDHALFDGGGELGRLFKEMDWSRSPLGPPAEWPQSLRSVVRIMLTSRYAMWLGWGEQLTFLYNDSYAQMTLGPKHPWALGRPASEVWAEIWPQIGPRIEKVLRTGEATWDEGLLLFLERRGYPEETYHTFSYSPLPDDRGNNAGNFCVVTEETDRVIGERRLASLRELASGLAAATSESEVLAAVESCLHADARDLPFSLCFLFDGEGNARLASHSGFSAADVPVPTVDQDLFQLRDIFAGRGPVLLDLRSWDRSFPAGPWPKAPGAALVVPLSQHGEARVAGAFVAGLNPYRPFDDTFRSFVTLFAGQIAAGITNARLYETERQRALALAELDRAKTAFFSNVSHEFRTPLTLMLGVTEDALTSGAALGKSELDILHRNELRLLKLVNSLLDFSRIEAGRAQASYEPTALAEMTADLASAFRSAVERGGLRFDVECPPLSEPIFVDPAMWEKIVLNLLSNAFKFTLEGSIRLVLAEAPSEVTLSVTDTGVGIEKHELGRVFERFHRIEGSRARTHEGSGIGLALVRDLVRLHGGSIRAESEPLRGTTFVVTLPKGSQHLAPDSVHLTSSSAPAALRGAEAFVAEAARWLPGASREREAPSLVPDVRGEGRPRILIADDNADMREYLCRLLGVSAEVELAGDGARALELALARPPNLIVSDVMMPTLDGLGLAQALRRNEATRHVPLLLLSARAGEEARIEGLQSGADDYLVKPFSARELAARVEVLLLRSQVRAREARQRQQMAEVFEQAPAAIAITRGPEHAFELANPAYLALVAEREVVGKPIAEALPELGGQGIFELMDRVYRTGEPFVGKSLRVMLTRSVGGTPEECFFDFVYQPIVGGDGSINGIAIVAFEVSDLVKARRVAEAANLTKDEFLAMLGHELRNPLAPILTALELMRLRGVTGGEKERAVVERQVRHLVGLVDDLLDVSRITRGKITLKLERFELAESVARAIEMASPLLEQQRHELRLEVAAQGLAVDADPGRLDQIIANLVTNAAKYTEPGGKIRVRGALEGESVVLTVSDSGIGIDPPMLTLIFESFAQGRQALDRSQGGLGLGLAIVRSLVQLHGGTVTASSEGRGRGSEFTVRLPHASGERVHSQLSPLPGAVTAKAVERRLRVLVVDDNLDAAEILEQSLTMLGFDVRVAHDGPSALTSAASFLPAVAILDLGLPVMDGYELARRIRDVPNLPNLELIALTGYGQEEDRRRSRAAGFSRHLVKPVDLSALRVLLEGLN